MNFSPKKLEVSKRVFLSFYSKNPNVNGVGIGKDCLEVRLVADLPENVHYPKHILDVPVNYQVIGTVRPL